MEKFLRVAWKKDQLNGEANFDINREGLSAQQPSLFNKRPTKVTAFEADLRDGIVAGRLRTEADNRFCILGGMMPSHSEPVIKALKREGFVDCAWSVPQIKSLKEPHPFSM